MPKLCLIGLIVMFVVNAVAAQDALDLSGDQKNQLQGAIVRLYAADADLTRNGTLLMPDYILSEFYGLETYRDDYACETQGHSTIEVTQSMYDATGEACLLISNADHNFALLKVETWERRGRAARQSAPPVIESEGYSTIGTSLYATFYDNQTRSDSLGLEDGTIVAMSLVPPEADGRTLQQRHYLIDFQAVTDETLGGPVINGEGGVIGITTSINVDPNGRRQLVRVLPLTTICRVDAEVCALISPPVLFPPQDRTQVPAGVETIQTGAIDFKTRIGNLCKGLGMTGDQADTESGWACWTSQGIGLELGALEIDMICQETYADMTAFALLSGPDEEMAYRWRCYRPQN